MSHQPSDKNVTLVLFHNDLRVADNATLSTAANLSSNGKLLLVYASSLAEGLNDINSDPAYHYDTMGSAREQFLQESLADLNASLTQLGNRLLYLKKDATVPDTLTQLHELIEVQQVTDICVSKTSDYYQNQVYALLQDKHPQIRWHVQTTATLFDELPLEQLPKSFTQFRKKIENDHDLLHTEEDAIICPTPESLAPMPESMADKSECFCDAHQCDLQEVDSFRGGESNGLKHLERYFDSEAPSTYKTTRNALDNWTQSTKLSAWLAND